MSEISAAPEEMHADAGYASGDNIVMAQEDHGTELKAPIGSKESDKYIPLGEFEFNEAGALRSSAREQLAYLAAQAGITSSSLSATMAMTHTSRYKNASVEMGLGWVISAAGYRWHNGATYGFETFVAFDKQARVGVVVLSNALTGYGPQTQLGKALIGLLTKQSYQAVSLPATISVPTATLDLYVGTYSASGFSLTVKRTGADLYATWTGQPDHRMYARTTESFYLRADVIGITLLKDSAGAYSSLSFSTGNGTHTLTRTP